MPFFARIVKDDSRSIQESSSYCFVAFFSEMR